MVSLEIGGFLSYDLRLGKEEENDVGRFSAGMDMVTAGKGQPRTDSEASFSQATFPKHCFPTSFCSFQFISSDFQRSVIIIGLEKIS